MAKKRSNTWTQMSFNSSSPKSPTLMWHVPLTVDKRLASIRWVRKSWKPKNKNWWMDFLYPSRLLFKFYCCLSLPSHGGIPPPSRGIVGKNQSTQGKTTVRSKRVGPLGQNGAPLLGSHSVTFFLLFFHWKSFRLNAFNVMHIHGPRFNAPQT